MRHFFDAILNFFGGFAGVLSTGTMYAIGIALSIPMTLIFLGELVNRQVVPRPPFVVKVERRWNTKALAIMAMTAALSVILQVLGSVIVLIPGTLTLRVDAMVRFSFGAIFGMPAVWGVMIANIIGDALSGTLGPGSIAGFIISWYQAYLFYRLFRAGQAAMGSAGLVARYYGVVLLWCFLGAFYLCTNFQMFALLPTKVIWVGVFPSVIVSTFLGGILGPVVARVVAPVAQRYGLAREEMNYERPAVAAQPA